MLVTKVDSSFIKGISYKRGRIVVAMDKKVYSYECEKHIFDAFLMSDSKGKFYTNVIKGYYTSKKIRPLFVLAIGGK